MRAEIHLVNEKYICTNDIGVPVVIKDCDEGGLIGNPVVEHPKDAFTLIKDPNDPRIYQLKLVDENKVHTGMPLSITISKYNRL